MSMSDRCLQSCQHLQQTCAILHHPYKECNTRLTNNITMWQHIATISGILCIYPIAGNLCDRGRIFQIFMESWVQRRTIFHWTWFLLPLVSKCGFLVTVPRKDPSKTWKWFHPARESNCKYQYTAQRWFHPARESNCKYQYTAQR